MNWVSIKDKLPEPHAVVLWYWAKQDTVLQGFLFYNSAPGENMVDVAECSFYFSLKDLTHWSTFKPPKSDL